MADAKIDKSLDDIIKERHIGRGGRGGSAGGRGGRGGARGSGRPGQRGGNNAMGRRPNTAGAVMKRRSAGGSQLSPSKAAASMNGQWSHDLYGGAGGRRSAASIPAAIASATLSGPAKLVISNLDFGVNDNDIKGLFQEFGSIRKAAVHYDRSGRSLGTADVVFERKTDAVKAQKKYNGVSLDGRPMSIQFTAPVGTVAVPEASRIYTPPAQQQQRNGGGGNRGSFQPRTGGFNSPRGARGGRGGGSARRGGAAGGGAAPKPAKKEPRTAADLDADLDAYSKMQTD